jgi:hypothetical protein
MNLTKYIEDLRRELAVAAEAGGEDARELADRLTAPLESATRLVLLEALSAAANEITRELAPGSVDVRLRGRDPEFVVTSPSSNQLFEDVADGGMSTGHGAPPQPPSSAELPKEDESGTARITLRLPELTKIRVDEAASRDGLSVNAWLARAVTDALQPNSREPRKAWRNPQGGQRQTGWVR